MSGVLYIVPTPIGNLEDITFRAINTLKEVDLILAEDTRQSKKLLMHYDIGIPLRSYHQHNEHKLTSDIVGLLKSGQNIAQVTDAGTPGISDPGFLLVRDCVKEGIKVVSLPGASAVITALAGSGLSSDRFFFEGFLPQKKGRQKRLNYLKDLPYTIVLYESPHRIKKLITQLTEFFSDETNIVIARELSKIYEEYIRGSLSEVKEIIENREIKGEIVVLINNQEI